MVHISELKPLMKRRGMFHMKHVTVTLATKYERLMGTASRHSLIGYLYEVCNLSDGKHTLGEIQRILRHELGEMDLEILAEMVHDMEALDYMALHD